MRRVTVLRAADSGQRAAAERSEAMRRATVLLVAGSW